MKYFKKLKTLMYKLAGKPTPKTQKQIQEEKFEMVMDAMKDFEEMYKRI